MQAAFILISWLSNNIYPYQLYLNTFISIFSLKINIPLTSLTPLLNYYILAYKAEKAAYNKVAIK